MDNASKRHNLKTALLYGERGDTKAIRDRLVSGPGLRISPPNHFWWLQKLNENREELNHVNY
jgi:hypothetical protein